MNKIADSKIKQAAKALDNAFKFKGVLEMADGFIFKMGLRALNDQFTERIPDKYEEIVNTLLDAVISGDYEGVTDDVADALNELVDIPKLNESEEDILINGALRTIVALVKSKRS